MNKPKLITDPQHIVFEGCDSVVMAPEDFENIQTELAAAIAQRDKARKDALKEAAKVCEQVLDARTKAHHAHGFNAIHACIEAIRAMKKECGK